MLRVIVVDLIALSCVACCSVAAAQTPSPYGRVNREVEGPIALAAAAGAALLPALLTSPTLDGPACGRCDPSAIALGVDRSVLGNRSRTASIVSDVLLYSLLLGAMTTPFWELAADNTDSRGAVTDFVVALEAVGLTFVVTQLFKFAVRRARPYSYDAGVPLRERRARQASLSFFSGHASLAFSAAVAQSYTFWRRHPGGAARYVVLSSTLTAAATTALMRVLAGKHYWSDVVVGALVGGLIGLLLPRLRDDGAARDDGTANIQLPLRGRPLLGAAPTFSLGARF